MADKMVRLPADIYAIFQKLADEHDRTVPKQIANMAKAWDGLNAKLEQQAAILMHGKTAVAKGAVPLEPAEPELTWTPEEWRLKRIEMDWFQARVISTDGHDSPDLFEDCVTPAQIQKRLDIMRPKLAEWEDERAIQSPISFRRVPKPPELP